MFIPDKPGYARAGEPWSRPTPAVVCDVPVGHLINDGAAVVLPPGIRSGFPGLLQAIDTYHRVSQEKKNVGFTADAKVSGGDSSDKDGSSEESW